MNVPAAAADLDRVVELLAGSPPSVLAAALLLVGKFIGEERKWKRRVPTSNASFIGRLSSSPAVAAAAAAAASLFSQCQRGARNRDCSCCVQGPFQRLHSGGYTVGGHTSRWAHLTHIKNLFVSPIQCYWLQR